MSSTTANDRPYGDFPKSKWRFVLPAFIEASHTLLLKFTGRDEMSVFQMLSAENTVQPIPKTGAKTNRPAPTETAKTNAADTMPTSRTAMATATNRQTIDRE